MGLWLNNDLQKETVFSRLLWNTVSFAFPFITHVILGSYFLIIYSEYSLSDYFFLILIIPICLIVFSFINSKFFDLLITIFSIVIYLFSIFIHNDLSTFISAIIISNGILFCFGYLLIKLSTNWNRSFSKGRFVILQNLLFLIITILFTSSLSLFDYTFQSFQIGTYTITLSILQIYLLITLISQFLYLLIQIFMTILITSEIFCITQKYREISSWSFDEKLLDEKLLNNKNNLCKLKRTVLIGDIRGYTDFSENNDTFDVIKILNKYYETVEKVISNYKGFKPEFIADEFITFFETPDMAIQCALDLKAELIKILHKYNLKVGIGIEEGEVIEGLVGGKYSKKYTLIGKAVNVASRYQNFSQNEEIIISGNILNKVKSAKAKYFNTLKIKGINGEKILYNVYDYELKQKAKSRTILPNIFKI